MDGDTPGHENDAEHICKSHAGVDDYVEIDIYRRTSGEYEVLCEWQTTADDAELDHPDKNERDVPEVGRAHKITRPNEFDAALRHAAMFWEAHWGDQPLQFVA